MSLDEKFEKAAVEVRNLVARPSLEDLYELYSLYKQAKVGDNNNPRPSMMQFAQRKQHDAWAKLKGMPNTEAKEKYIAKVESLISSIGVKA